VIDRLRILVQRAVGTRSQTSAPRLPAAAVAIRPRRRRGARSATARRAAAAGPERLTQLAIGRAHRGRTVGHRDRAHCGPPARATVSGAASMPDRTDAIFGDFLTIVGGGERTQAMARRLGGSEHHLDRAGRGLDDDQRVRRTRPVMIVREGFWKARAQA
jgi:hypothetical protein